MDNDKNLQEAYIDEVYASLENEITNISGVYEFTSGGFQNIVQGISKVFGKKMRKGLLIHYKKDKIEVNVSISVKVGFKLCDLACEIQKCIKSVLKNNYSNNIGNINVTITEIVR